LIRQVPAVAYGCLHPPSAAIGYITGHVLPQLGGETTAG
jgi:hypothetical protein